MFLLERTYKEEEEGDLKEFWHFGQYVDKIQNMQKNILIM
jgi:hypothetical protein